jgi:hypothetical protein
MNDEGTLRKGGAATDVYTVFRRMLESGDVPSCFKELAAGSTAFSPSPMIPPCLE